MTSGVHPFAVCRLSLHCFRNYPALRLEPATRLTALVGPNGAGKTNLLEALSFLAPGRGLRRASLSELGHRGNASWSVSADVMGPDGPLRLATGMVDGMQRREVRIDGITQSGPGQLDDISGAVWLVPAMDRLLVEGASPRRRFMDRLVQAGDPAHASQLRRYEHLMRERSHLLRSGRTDPRWLQPLEEEMAAAGVAIAAARLEVVAGLNQRLKSRVSAFPAAALSPIGALEADLQKQPALDVEDGFAADLKRHRSTDATLGGAGIGPHRSDLKIMDVDQQAPAERQSTGRQKALLIGLILAECQLFRERKGFWPLLLLDEIGAHLDRERRGQLAAELAQLGAQTWLTGTEANLFDGFDTDCRVLHVDNARITEHGL